MANRSLLGLWVSGITLALVAACSTSPSDQTGTHGLPESLELLSIQDLSGIAGTPGTATKEGMEVAVEEINATGYLGSTKLQIKYEDSASNPEPGASLISRAVQAKYPLVFGSVLSTTAIAQAPIAQRGKLPTIFTQAGSDGVLVGEYIYRATPLQTTLLPLAGAYIQKQGWKKLGLMYNTNNPTAVAGAEEYQRLGSQFGYSFVDVEKTSSTQTDLTTQVSQIVAAKPDAVIIWVVAAQNVTAVTSLRQAGYTGPIIAQVGVAGGVLAPLGDKANGILWATDFTASQTNPEAVAFVTAYEKKYGKKPSNFAAEGYDAVWFAARALKKAQSTDRTAVLTALQAVAAEGFNGALGAISFDKNQEITSGFLVEHWNGEERLLS